MTALNIIEQPHAAFMLVDAASVDRDGRVQAVRSKVALLPHLSAAAAWTGWTIATDANGRSLQEALAGCQDQDALRAAVPALARAWRDENLAAGLPSEDSDVSIMLALWSHAADRPEAWFARSDEGTPEMARVRAVVDTDGLEAPVPGFPGVPVVAFSDPARFNARRDAARLIEAQRRELMAPNGHPAVGGFAELVEVSGPGRLSCVIVARWPDRIGEVIDTAMTHRRRLAEGAIDRFNRFSSRPLTRMVAAGVAAASCFQLALRCA